MSGADYSRALARVAVAQLAELAGFDAAHESAVDILGDLLQRYLANVCAGAHDYAELAGRTHTNSLDALLALEDLGVTPDELDVFAGLTLQVSGGRRFNRYGGSREVQEVMLAREQERGCLLHAHSVCVMCLPKQVGRVSGDSSMRCSGFKAAAEGRVCCTSISTA
jgi:histone H3/H4